MSESEKDKILRAVEHYFHLVIVAILGWDLGEPVKVVARWVGGEVVEVQVPKRFVGVCIGRDGDTVMAAQKDFKVRITVKPS